MPDWRQEALSSRAPSFSVIPGISVSRSGSFSSTSRLDAPKQETIFSAVFAPMPLTAREDRNEENLRLRLRHEPLEKLRLKLAGRGSDDGPSGLQ